MQAKRLPDLDLAVWSRVFGDAKMTTALLNRHTHHCHIGDTGNESIRLSRSIGEANKRIKAREQARKGLKPETEGESFRPGATPGEPLRATPCVSFRANITQHQRGQPTQQQTSMSPCFFNSLPSTLLPCPDSSPIRSWCSVLKT